MKNHTHTYMLIYIEKARKRKKEYGKKKVTRNI